MKYESGMTLAALKLCALFGGDDRLVSGAVKSIFQSQSLILFRALAPSLARLLQTLY